MAITRQTIPFRQRVGVRIGAIVAPVVLAAGVLAAAETQASPIGPGFDFFITDGAFSPFPGNSFVDLVALGAPLGSPDALPVAVIGETPKVSGLPVPMPPGLRVDTIIERAAGISTLNQGDEATIPIELVALSLVSVDPVDIGGVLFDLSITDGAFTPTGSMTVRHELADGGTWSAVFDLMATGILQPVGNPTSGPTPISFDVEATIMGAGDWTHRAYPTIPNLPAGDFYPIGLSTWSASCPIPPGGEVTCIQLIQSPAFQPVPEPTTLALFGLGLAGIAFGAKRKKCAAEGSACGYRSTFRLEPNLLIFIEKADLA